MAMEINIDNVRTLLDFHETKSLRVLAAQTFK